MKKDAKAKVTASLIDKVGSMKEKCGSIFFLTVNADLKCCKNFQKSSNNLKKKFSHKNFKIMQRHMFEYYPIISISQKF